MEVKENPHLNLRGLSADYKDIDYFIKGEEFVVGRLPECDLVINETTISAEHAKICRVENHWEVVDLKSTNGTSVNGKRIDRRILRTEDKISFDQYEFLFINRKDVSRTEVVSGPAFEKLRSTEVRGKEEPPSPAPQPAVQPQAVQPPPQAQPVQPPLQQSSPQPSPRVVASPLPVVDREKPFSSSSGSLFPGLFLGVLLSFVVILGGSFLVGLAMSSGSTLVGAGNILKMVIIGLPLQHLPPFWFALARFSVASIIILILILFTLPAAGFVVQRNSRRDRFSAALLFSAIYFGFWNILQLAVIGFSFRGWQVLYAGNGLGISDLTLGWLAGEGVFFLMVLLLSFAGTLLARSAR